MTIEEAVDQVQITGPAASGADRELARQMRLGTRSERGHLLVPDMHPVYPALTAERVGQPVEAVSDNAIDSLDTRCCEGFRELIGDGLCHDRSPRSVRTMVRRVSRWRAVRRIDIACPRIGLWILICPGLLRRPR